MRVVITGGIASGKSTVVELVCKKGYHVVCADLVNSSLLESRDYIERLAKIFPSAVQDGVVSREEVRNQMLLYPEKRGMLNELAHPMIVEIMKNEYKAPITFFELPLLSQAVKYGFEYDKLWYVEVSEAIRIKRLIKRSCLSYDEAKAMSDVQSEERGYKALADEVIDNDGDIKSLEVKVDKLLNRLKQDIS